MSDTPYAPSSSDGRKRKFESVDGKDDDARSKCFK